MGGCPRGLEDQQQAGAAPVAGGRPQGAVSQAQEAHRGSAHGRCHVSDRAEHIWALDFQFDRPERPHVKVLNIVDEFTREARPRVDRPIDADKVVGLRPHRRASAASGVHPLRNGPEFISHAVAGLVPVQRGRTIYIEPGSPWQNPWIESFNGRLRDELLNSGTSTASSKPRCSSRTGGWNTTATGRTAPTATSPRRVRPAWITRNQPTPHSSGPLTGARSPAEDPTALVERVDEFVEGRTGPFTQG